MFDKLLASMKFKQDTEKGQKVGLALRYPLHVDEDVSFNAYWGGSVGAVF